MLSEQRAQFSRVIKTSRDHSNNKYLHFACKIKKKCLPISPHKMLLKGKWKWPHKQWMGRCCGAGSSAQALPATDSMLSWGFFSWLLSQN